MSMATGIGMHVMKDMFAGNSEDTDFLRKRDMLHNDIAKENSEENVELRKTQIKKATLLKVELKFYISFSIITLLFLYSSFFFKTITF